MLLVLGIGRALAAEPIAACDPKEPLEVCQLEIQRNHALNDLAISEGARQRDALQAETLAQWWKSYVVGVTAQHDWWAKWWDETCGKHHHC